MKLRLVDGGIPSFEWKFKRFELPFSEEEMNLLNERIELGELDELTAFKKRYEMKDNPELNLELYRKILRKLPSMPGNLVLAKTSEGKMEIIEVFKSELDLREDFKNSKKQLNDSDTDRFNWLKNLTKVNGISSIHFFLGRAA
jgi:hypothetical protein